MANPKPSKPPTAKTPRTPGGYHQGVKKIDPKGPWGGIRQRQKALDDIMKKK